MATLRELVVRFRLKADTKAIKDFEGKLKDVGAAASDLVGYAAKLAGGYAALGGVLAHTAAGAADFAEETIRTASAFDMSTGRVQELSFAFQALGASQDDMADMFSTLAERSTLAIEGSKEMRKNFARIGISVDELRGKNVSELFDMYIDGASNATDTNQALTASAGLLGDDLGRRVAKGLRTAGSSFQDYITILRKTGGVFPEGMLEQAQKAQIQFRLLGATFSVLRKRIGLQLAPVFGDFAEKIVHWFSKNTEAVDIFVERLINGVQRELGRLVLVARSADRFVSKVFGGWIHLAEGLAVASAAVVTAVGGQKVISVFSAIQAAVAAMTGPLAALAGAAGLIALVVGGLVLVFDDLLVYMEGGDSLIGRLIERFGTLGPLGEFIAWVLEATATNFVDLVHEAGALFEELSPLITVFKALGSLIITVIGTWLVGAFNIAIGMIRGVVLVVRILSEMVKVAFGGLSLFVDELFNAFSKFPEAFPAFVRAGIEAALGLLDIFGDKVSSVMSDLNPFGSENRVNMALTNYANDQAATRAGDSATRGGQSSVSQTNEFNATINANSEAEGRAAARGFTSEVKSSDLMSSMQERMSYGEI